MRKKSGKVFLGMEEVIKLSFKVIEGFYDCDEDGKKIGIFSGFQSLDHFIGGFKYGDVTVIAGRPGSGKSTFAFQTAYNAASKFRNTVGLITLKLSLEQLGMKFICFKSGLDSSRIGGGLISRFDWPRLTSAAGQLVDASIYVDDCPSESIGELVRRIMDLKAERQEVKLVVIDSLQMIVSENRGKLSECLKRIKMAAQSMQLSVIITSSINSVRNQKDNGGTMGDPIYQLIEGYSDLLLLLKEHDTNFVISSGNNNDGAYRDPLSTKGKNRTPAKEDSNVNKSELLTRVRTELIVAKNKKGPTGTLYLDYYPERGRFKDIAQTT